MARPNVIYNCQALYVGPAPETGYNFINYAGKSPTNNDGSTINPPTGVYQQLNLLHSIDRLQSVSYSINVPHTDINQINQRGLIAREIINYPTVNLNFNYLLCGTKNEARIGLNVNYPQFQYPLEGSPLLFKQFKCFPSFWFF